MLMTNTSQSEIPNTQVWSSVGSMALCVSLLTPMRVIYMRLRASPARRFRSPACLRL